MACRTQSAGRRGRRGRSGLDANPSPWRQREDRTRPCPSLIGQLQRPRNTQPGPMPRRWVLRTSAPHSQGDWALSSVAGVLRAVKLGWSQLDRTGAEHTWMVGHSRCRHHGHGQQRRLSVAVDAPGEQRVAHVGVAPRLRGALIRRSALKLAPRRGTAEEDDCGARQLRSPGRVRRRRRLGPSVGVTPPSQARTSAWAGSSCPLSQCRDARAGQLPLHRRPPRR